MDKLTCIKEILNNNDCIYAPIYTDTSIDNIYNLFVNNIIFKPIDIVDHLYLGIYYDKIVKDNYLMNTHYKYAIKQGDIYALFYYCFSCGNNCSKIKYYKIGINKKIIIFSASAGVYYRLNYNYDEMKKCFDDFLNDNNSLIDILHQQYSYTNEDYEYTKSKMDKIYHDTKIQILKIVASYYYNIEKNYDMGYFYLLQVDDDKDTNVMNMLGLYYYNHKQNYKAAKQYYLKSANLDDKDGKFNLGDYYYKKEKYNKMKYYYDQIIDEENVLNMMHHHYVSKRNYKMAKMYLFTYYDFNDVNNAFTIMDSYKCHDLLKRLLLLEHYLNAQSFVNRDKIVSLFVSIAYCELSNKMEIKFIQLVKEFEFNDKDSLSVNMLLYLKK